MTTEQKADALREAKARLRAFVQEHKPGGCKWLSKGPSACECPLCDIDRLTAQATREAGTGWQPIETAPKDGTKVLLLKPEPEPGYANVNGDITIGWWFGSWADRSLQRWTSTGVDILNPRGWMPLPPIPAPSKGEGGT